MNKKYVVYDGGDWHQFLSNAHLEVLMADESLITELKPLRDLWAHDNRFYIDAFVMWQWRYVDGSNDWTDCNKPLSFKADKEYRRKESAELPFDLERAKAGDVVEIMEWKDRGRNFEWRIYQINFINCFERKDGGVGVIPLSHLRMKYPPRKPA